MVWDNKGDSREIIFIIFIVLLLGGFFKALSSNEYTSYMYDCENNKINKQMFEFNFNGTCYSNIMDENTKYNCVKTEVDIDRLNLYCQNNYNSQTIKEID